MALRTYFCLGLGFFAGAAGCQTLKSGTNPSGQTVMTVPEGAVITKEADLPPRDPKANTCVAYADFRAKEAHVTDQPADARDSMREQARRAYFQALTIDPKNLKAHQGLARLQAESGDHEQALATLNKGLKYHPKEASLWYDLGLAHARKKEWQPSLEALGKAAELDPNNRTYINVFGYALARTGRFDESLACFARLNGEAKAHYNLARMLNHLDQRELSITHLQLALQRDPGMDSARQLLAQFEGQALQANAAQTDQVQNAHFAASTPVAAPSVTEQLRGAPSVLPFLKEGPPVTATLSDMPSPAQGGVLLPRPPMIFNKSSRALSPTPESRTMATPIGVQEIVSQ